MKINNSKENAINEGKWTKPGADFFDKLKEESNYKALIKEAYLMSPDNIERDTVFSNSNCKYPHHVISDNELRLSVPGVKAAINRLRQQGAYSGEAKSHIDRHIKELGLNTYIHEDSLYVEEDAIYMKQIVENFNDIENKYL